MTVVDIYGRVSRASDTRMRSTDGQVGDCRAILLDAGHEVGMVHVDPGRSAWNPKVRRPDWDMLMHRLEHQLTGGVIVFDLARFTRRPPEGERLIAAAEHGLIVMDSEDNYDLTTANGKKAFRDAMAGAAYESDRLSTRVKRGKRIKAANGEHNSSTRAFGFAARSSGLVIDEAEAAELRDAAERLLAGEDQVSICADFNRRGVLTALGGTWKPPALRVALCRPGNAGDVAHQGVVVRRDAHPAILTRDVYEQVLALYAGRRRGRPTSNLCTGFVRCGGCGRGLHAKELIRHTPYPDGRRARAYLCIKRDGGCGNTIDWLDLDTFVRGYALDRLADPSHARQVEAGVRAVASELDTVQARIGKLETLVKDLAARWGSGDLEEFEWEAARAPLKPQLTKLRAQEAVLLASAPQRRLAVVRRSRDEWERRWDGGSLADRRDIVAQALSAQWLLLSPGPRLQPARERASLGGVEATGQGGGVGDVGGTERG